MPDPGPTIADILTAATQPTGNHHVRSVLSAAPDWLTDRALAHGLDIAGFVHTVDTSAIRHIIARHFNAKVEKSRGQIALTNTDLERVPNILANPDQLVFGAKNPRHQPMIGYIKRFPDGVILYLEELRTGRKELAAVSMRKHPATALSGSIAATLEPNGRTDGEDTLYIIDLPSNVTNPVIATEDRRVGCPSAPHHEAPHPANTNHPRLRRLAKVLPPALGILVLIGVIFGLHGALSKIGPRDVLAALAATSAAQLRHAGFLLALSFVIMLAYDIPGILFAAKLPAFPRLAARRIGFASFCAYALSHVLGAPALSAAAIRVRLYAQWGAPPAGIARIIALSGTSFALGATTLFGFLLLCRPADLPLPDNGLSTLALRAIGASICAAILAYAFIAQARTSLTLFGRALPLPGRALASLQIILSSADIAIASAILYVVLPAAPGLTPAHVLAIYLAAFAAGLVSSLPAGVGVFDTLLLLGLAPYMPAADAIGAILLFRVIYYLAPATGAGLAFAIHEILLTAKKR
jgi:uncharacterized membrane protein YbhN (UPF0104 family)